MIEEKEYKNIPESRVIASDIRRDKTRATVELLRCANLVIPSFSIIQFIEGANIWAKDVKVVSFQREAIQLLALLAKSLPLVAKDATAITITVSLNDLGILRKWLELRMKHCELERDNRILCTDKDHKEIPGQYKFNPDSYIAMKLLLLDIRELMLGDIIVE